MKIGGFIKIWKFFMKINRWIYVPLNLGLSYVIVYFICGFVKSWQDFVFYFVVGSGFGFVIQLWSDIRAKKISGKDTEEIHKVRQNRKITLFLDYERSFELCKEAVQSLNPAKIKKEDFENGILTARTRMNWNSFGTLINLNLKKINQNLTEIEISTRPVVKSTIVDYGESWKISEDICSYLKSEDAEINKNLLVESASILDDIYVKPFQKETVQR